jgi:hypothetical protein
VFQSHGSGPPPGDLGTLAAPVATEGLLLFEVEPFEDSLLVVGVKSFLRIKLLRMIADLDNLFVAARAMTAKNVSSPLPA